MDLKNKVVVITGGTKGLGRAMARSFLKEEARVVVCSRSADEINEITKEGIFGVVADVTKENDMNHLLEVAKEKFGQVDIWINNAGLWLPKQLAEDFDMVEVKKMFEVNVFGLMNGSRIVLREMKKNGLGTIINIISDSALIGRAMSSMYSSSKWAASGFTKSIREENKNISIIGIYPGPIQTDIFGENKPDGFDNFMKKLFILFSIFTLLVIFSFSNPIKAQACYGYYCNNFPQSYGNYNNYGNYYNYNNSYGYNQNSYSQNYWYGVNNNFPSYGYMTNNYGSYNYYRNGYNYGNYNNYFGNGYGNYGWNNNCGYYRC